MRSTSLIIARRVIAPQVEGSKPQVEGSNLLNPGIHSMVEINYLP